MCMCKQQIKQPNNAFNERKDFICITDARSVTALEGGIVN